MKKLLLLFVFCPLLSIAQNIKGIIVSQQNALPIENTNVYASLSKTGTISNDKGEFSINILPQFKDDEILEFSHIGFTTLKISLDVLKKNKFTVLLSSEIENLSELKIKANHELYLKSKLDFSLLAPLKYPVFSFGSLLKDGKIYVIGGDGSRESDSWKKVTREKADTTLKDLQDELRYNSTFLFYKGDFSTYDIKTDTWETLPIKFIKRAYHDIHLYNNSIYVLGGKRISVNGKFEYLQDQIEVLDLEKLNVKVDKTNPHQAANFASFMYKDNIIVMGGSIKTTEAGVKDFTDKVHLYNIASGYWYELTSMPTAEETTGILVDNKIYLIGGNNGKPISKIESFDLVTEKWQTEGELFSGLERPAIAYNDNAIYFFEDGKMYTYNLKSKLLKEYEIELRLKYSAMYYYDNKLYILGGRTDINYSTNPSSKVFSIDINEFETTKPTRIKTLSQEVGSIKNNG